MEIRRLCGEPIIDRTTVGYNPRIHDNINGPSLIRVPEWVVNPLGRYYLYFAHHQGDHIRMAYADNPAGPYTIFKGGVLNLTESRFVDHMASPDVHVDHAVQQIRMYYHGVLTPPEQQQVIAEIDEPFFYKQRTRVALSSDGLHFEEQPQIITSAYLRVVNFQGMFYGITMPGLLYRSINGLDDFERGPLLFGNDKIREAFFFSQGQSNPRHFAIQKQRDSLRLFFSLVPDTPESIYFTDIVLDDDWVNWKINDPVRILYPDTHYEGADLPLEPSARGWSPHPVYQLRDPAIFEESGRTFLLYSVAGERGIAIAELLNTI